MQGIGRVGAPVLIAGMLLAGIAVVVAAETPVDSGKAEQAWLEYLEQSDSKAALELFERCCERPDAAPLEWLGSATILDHGERLAEARTAYERTLDAIWREIQSLDAKTTETLKQAEASTDPSQLETGAMETLDRALWLWATGSLALHASNKIAPYGGDPGPYLDLLETIAETEAVPDWPGFHALQGEVRTVLAEKRLERGEFELAEALVQANGLIRDFFWIGPFPNKEEAGYAEVYPPEADFDPEGRYEGKIRPVEWRPLRPRPSWDYVNFKALVEPTENSTAYALTFIYSAADRPVAVELGHAGAAKVWIGGRWIVGQDAYHDATAFQVRAPAQLEAGWNPVLVKLCCEEPAEYGFYLRLTTPEGRPLRDGGEEKAPVRFWKLGQPVPGEPRGWPVEQETTIAEDWVQQSLDRLIEPEREPLVSTLATWLSVAYLHFHNSLDENSTEAIDRMRTAEKQFPDSSLVQVWLGFTERDENRMRQAYEKAAAIDPGQVLALSRLARHDQSKPYKERMLLRLEQALARNPESARLWLLRGESRWKPGGSAVLAKSDYERALQLSPHYYFGFYRLAETQNRTLTLDKRTSLFEQALERNRTVAEVRLALMQEYLRAGRTEDAVKQAVEGAQIDPYDSRFFTLLAKHYRAAENWQAAEAAVSAAQRMTPDRPAVNQLAGAIYHAQGRDDEAREVWGRALEVRPNMPELEEYLALIEDEGEDYCEPYRIDLAQLPGIGAEDYPDAQVVVLLDQSVERVYANGTSSRTIHMLWQALTDSGVNQLKSHTIYFDPGQEKVKIKRARVLRSDGTVFDAPRPAIRSARGGGNLVYGDYSVQVLSFPSVDKGSRVDLEYEVEQTGKNIYVDYYGSSFYFGQFAPCLLTEYVLITPRERTFYSKLTEPDERYGLPEAQILDELPDDRFTGGNFFLEQGQDDQRVWIWNYTNRPQIKVEPAMPASSELVPYVKVSTFKTWDDMAGWYWDLIEDQFLVDDAVRQEVEALVGQYSAAQGRSPDSLSQLDVVKALNGFVNTQVRYLGLEFGIHGYKPHRVADIYNAKYGDCKDKATLMLAMAGEKQIPGRIALLRTRDRGRIDYGLPSLHLFNHAIIYFPDVDGQSLVLDGTAQFFGTMDLPTGDQGVDLLTVAPGGAYEFVQSPIATAEINQARYRTELRLAKDGSAEGFRRSDYRGIYNPSVRSIYQNRGKVKEIVEKQFGSTFPGATASQIELSNLDDYETPEWIQFRLSLPRFADRPAGQQQRLTFRPILFPSELSRSYAALPRREHELVLRFNWSRERRTEIAIPEGYRAVQLPESQDLSGSFGFLKLNCRADGEKVIVEQSIGLQVDSLRVPVEQYEAFREFCSQVDHAEEQQVVLERSGD